MRNQNQGVIEITDLCHRRGEGMNRFGNLTLETEAKDTTLKK